MLAYCAGNALSSCKKIILLHFKFTNHFLPSILQFSGYKECSEGRNCSVWVYVKIEGYKKSTYTMHTSGIMFDQPVHYEIMGYDQYEMDYMNYSVEVPPSGVFDIMEGLFVELYMQNVCIILAIVFL